MKKYTSLIPEIGIVITTHNYGHYLEQCVASVINQKHAPTWQMMIVDDGSADDTPVIVEKYADDLRIKSMRLSGVGLACAANQGIAALKTPWVLRVDADDWLEQEALARLYARAKKNQADMVYGDLHLVNEQGLSIGVQSQSNEFIGSALERSPVGSGMLYRRQVWEVVNGYDESLRYQEDFDFWLKASERFIHVHEPKALYAYRQHSMSMSTNRRPRARCRAEVKHAAMLRRGLSLKGGVLGVIDTVPFIGCRIDSRVGLMNLGDRPLLEHGLNHLANLESVSEVRVRTDCPEIKAWAQSRNLEVLAPGTNTDWLQDLRRQAGGGLSLGNNAAIGCSPYFPMQDAYRYQEILDTLLLGSYARVDSVIADPYPTMMPGKSGWTSLCSSAEQSSLDCRLGKMRMTGGLSAAWTGVDAGGWGCVEMTWPEDFAVRDEETLNLVSGIWRGATPTKCLRR